MRSALLGANGYVKCLAYLADIAISFSASFRQADKLDRRRDRSFFHWLSSLFVAWIAMLPVVVLAAPAIRAISISLTREE